MTSKNLSPELSIKISDFRIQKGKYVEYLIVWSYKSKNISSFYARYSKLNTLNEEILSQKYDAYDDQKYDSQKSVKNTIPKIPQKYENNLPIKFIYTN